MLYTVTVSFGQNNEYEFRFADADVASVTRDSAREWLHREFDALECVPRNPVGKLILLDVIMDVAKYCGEQRFAENGEWARAFARCAAVALGRDTLRIDVPNMTIG